MDDATRLTDSWNWRSRLCLHNRGKRECHEHTRGTTVRQPTKVTIMTSPRMFDKQSTGKSSAARLFCKKGLKDEKRRSILVSALGGTGA